MSAPREPNFGWGRRLPITLQTEAAECGLVCLSMIASLFGYAIDPAELRRRYGLSMKGATLRDLVAIADQLGMASRPVRLELDELALLRTPCVLHWDLNHFVVLKSITRNGIIIHDPAQGMLRLSLMEASRHFTGIALELTPTGGFKITERPPRLRIRALLGNLVGIGRSLLQLLTLALAIEIISMISPFFLGWVIDYALVSGDQGLLITLVLGFTLLLLLRTAISAMRDWMLLVIGASLKVQARANLFSHLLNLPASYFESRYLGDVMSRFGSQETILRAITTELVLAVIDGLMCSITLVLMFAFAPELTAIVLVGAALYGGLRWATYAPLRQASAEAIVWSARRDSHFLETMRGIKTIKLFNAHEDRRAHWLNLLIETVNRQLVTEKLAMVFHAGNSLLFGIITILVIWLGAERILAATFSVGLLIAFMAYKDQFLSRTSELIDRVVDLKMLRLHAERLADIALTEPEKRTTVLSPTPVQRAAPAIEVRDLCFGYSSNERPVLDKLSFRIEPGESVAITGPSGCGKTTLLKLLAGLLQLSSGEILIDGEPLSRIGLEHYRAMIGVVMQEDQLFAGSITDNICFFASNPDQSRIRRCAELACIHDDIAAMPMSYSTLIGDMGTVLSGGQKQRVLIARALYREPAILMLDEATSHLDVDRERAVNAAISATDMTRIIIAHRPETIRACDRAIVLQDGKVVRHEQSRPSEDITIDLATEAAATGHSGGAYIKPRPGSVTEDDAAIAHGLIFKFNSNNGERLQNIDKKDVIGLYYKLLSSGHSAGGILEALNSTQSKTEHSNTAVAEYSRAKSDRAPTDIAAEIASVQAAQAKTRPISGLNTAYTNDDSRTEQAQTAESTPLEERESDNREQLPNHLCGSEPDILASAGSQTSTNCEATLRPGEEERIRPGKFPGVARRIAFGTLYAAAIASAAVVGFSFVHVPRDIRLTSARVLSSIFGGTETVPIPRAEAGRVEAGRVEAGRAEAIGNKSEAMTQVVDAEGSRASETLRPVEPDPGVPGPAQPVAADVRATMSAAQSQAQEIQGSEAGDPDANRVSAIAETLSDPVIRDEALATATTQALTPAPEAHDTASATVAGAEHRSEDDRSGAPGASLAETARAEQPDTARPPAGEAAAAAPAPRIPEITPEETPFKTSEADALVTRGDAFFAAGDVASARLFYEYATAGNGVAALRLGSTFDPNFLAQAHIGRVQGDAAIALYWYRRARDLGNGDAEVLLRKMEKSAQ